MIPPARSLLLTAMCLLHISALVASDKADFWTFKPVTRPELPLLKDAGPVQNTIDLFMLEKQKANGLSPSKQADPRVVIRRVTLDLWGLLPSPDEIEEFVRNPDRAAWIRVVDRLLASPRYGERWARHWLDVVHFGESHGYDKDKPRPNAWPYRDYVIRSLNEDKPWSRFVREQIAGDVLFPDDPEGIVATGFIAAGPWDFVGHVELPITKTDGLIARYNDRDDMVAATMTAFESLTVHCARCHDHKFDPIAQREYYALQAVFAGVDRADRAYDEDPKTQRARVQLASRIREVTEKLSGIDGRIDRAQNATLEEVDLAIGAVERGFREAPLPGVDSPSNGYHSAVAKDSRTRKWVQVDLRAARPIDEIKLIPARPTDFPDTPGFGFPKRFKVEVFAEKGREATVLADYTAADFPNPGTNVVVVRANGLSGQIVRITATELWERTSDFVFALAELEIWSGGTNLALEGIVTALDSIESGRWRKEALVDRFGSRKSLVEKKLPPLASERVAGMHEALEQLKQRREILVESIIGERSARERRQLREELRQLETRHKELPPRKYVYAAAADFPASGNFKPAGKPRPVHLLKRGDVKSPIAEMAPGALAALPGLPAELAVNNLEEEGERRAALARWLTDSHNVQMRRSIVNRVWQYHFGKGLVETPNDFGHMGTPPSHRELLDWLACWFMEHGESLKELHRLILTSAAYAQNFSSNPAFARIDSENRLLWRMDRQRLDAEQFHDCLLQLSGNLSTTMGGPSVKQFYFKDDHSPVYDYTRYDPNEPGNSRRAIYRFLVRSVPDPFMEALDCPDASILTGKRSVTITALQALAGLNNPFVLKQAEDFARRLRLGSPDLPAQVEHAVYLAFGRLASDHERRSFVSFAEESGLENLCRVLFNSNEFMFID